VMAETVWVVPSSVMAETVWEWPGPSCTKESVLLQIVDSNDDIKIDNYDKPSLLSQFTFGETGWAWSISYKGGRVTKMVHSN